MPRQRLILLGVLLLAIILFFAFGIDEFFSLESFNQQRQALNNALHAYPVLSALSYFLVYVVVTALSLPGAAVMTLAGGALFGFTKGVLLVSFASTIGATLAFLLSRWLFRDWVQERFGEHLASVNRGIEKDGVRYLFTLRLVPLFPFFVINLLMGLTPLKVREFFLVSQIGMLPATAVFVNAGTQLAAVESLGGLLSPALLLSFAVLGLFPWLVKWLTGAVAQRRLLQKYSRPKQFDANLIVIGAGSAGLVASLIAAAIKAKVVLVEKHKMGGDCLNTGCVPSKTLISSARLKHQIDQAAVFGIDASVVGIDFEKVMNRVQDTIKTIEPHDSVERYTELGVDCVQGDAELLSPWEVRVGDQVISAAKIIIASGATPRIPPIPGLELVPYVSSENVWQLRQLPRRLLVLGGGPIGCELAQAFARLGSEVSIISRAAGLLPREDDDVAAFMTERFRSENIKVLCDHRAKAFSATEGSFSLMAEHGDEEAEIPFDLVLIAIGRRAAVDGMGLRSLGIVTSPDGTLEVNEYLQTAMPTVYACGDVVGPYQFTHMASHQAWYATVNALFGRFKRFKVDYSVVPWATFTDPEVARVGLNETDARAQNTAYELSYYSFEGHDRALAEGNNQGFVKVLTVPGKDRILGATIVGPHAGELIGEFVTAMRHKLGLNKILGTIHIYPTWSEANKFAAGNWRKAHAPERVLGWVEKYHRWIRTG
jgi:pyruvate/2-oxoglutarate dehydrogenase complex dihydrolipoamide dehydrogenase (E3) component/uncharacterized membrane protein YdjX (TVP38/TMEM64 family)